MNNFKFVWIGSVLILTVLACQSLMPATPSSAKVYDHPTFSFTIPAGWQTMEELWGQRQQAERNYYQLGVDEIIMVTNARKQGDGTYRAYFAVASSPLAGGVDLEERFHRTYDPLIPDLRAVTQTYFDNGTLRGLEITYERPWGEPWWKFRDIWVENDAVIYVLSFHCPPGDFETYQGDFELILKSFNFK